MKLNKKSITLGILGSAILAYGVAPALTSVQNSVSESTSETKPYDREEGRRKRNVISTRDGDGVTYTFRREDVKCITETINGSGDYKFYSV